MILIVQVFSGGHAFLDIFLHFYAKISILRMTCYIANLIDLHPASDPLLLYILLHCELINWTQYLIFCVISVRACSWFWNSDYEWSTYLSASYTFIEIAFAWTNLQLSLGKVFSCFFCVDRFVNVISAIGGCNYLRLFSSEIIWIQQPCHRHRNWL